MDETHLKEKVQKILAEEIGPALAMEGTLIEVLDVADGVVRLRLGGVGGCCPNSWMAFLHGMEEELRRRVPEVDYLEAVP